MSLQDWPAEERPREKLLAQGAEALSDAELLAIFLRVGIKGKTAVDLARDMLRHFGGLAGLLQADCQAFSALPGLGSAKYAQLRAAVELSRRALACDMRQRPALSSPNTVGDYLRLTIGSLQHEVFTVLFLDVQNRLIAPRQMFTGTLSQASVYPREVVKMALQYNAAAVILAHNHPSGVCEPSPSDKMMTQELQRALSLVDVRVLDHVIVSGHAPVYSFAERGLMP